MARLTAVDAEVARRVDDAGAKVIVPEPVGDHACGERIGRRGDPIGERPATVSLRGVGRELPRGTESREASRSDLLAGRHRVATEKTMRLLGRNELAGIGLRQRLERLELLLEIPRRLGKALHLGQLIRGELGGRRDRADPRRASVMHVVVRQPIGVGSNDLPVLAVERRADLVFRRQSVGVFRPRTAVAAPDNAAEFLYLREFQLYPSPADLVRDPRPLVAVLAVVDVLEFVVGIVGEGARGRRFRPARRIAAVNGERLQFVEAGFRCRRVEDREPYEPCLRRREGIDVFAGRHRATQVWSPVGHVVERLLLFEDHGVGRDWSCSRTADDEEPRSFGERMHAGLAQAAPERLALRRLAAAIGPESRVEVRHESLVDGGDQGLVCRGLGIAVGVEHVFRVPGMRVPAGAPGEPDSKHAGGLGAVGEDGLTGCSLPPGVFLSDIGE